MQPLCSCGQVLTANNGGGRLFPVAGLPSIIAHFCPAASLPRSRWRGGSGEGARAAAKPGNATGAVARRNGEMTAKVRFAAVEKNTRRISKNIESPSRCSNSPAASPKVAKQSPGKSAAPLYGDDRHPPPGSCRTRTRPFYSLEVTLTGCFIGSEGVDPDSSKRQRL